MRISRSCFWILFSAIVCRLSAAVPISNQTVREAARLVPQVVEEHLAGRAKNVRAVRYGNSIYGMFRTERVEHLPGGRLRWRYIPPGYKKPLLVSYETRAGLIPGRSLRPESPFPPEWNWMNSAGRFSTPFFLGDVHIDVPDNSAMHLAAIWNRSGEVLWAVPEPSGLPPRRFPLSTSMTVRSLGPGRVGILRAQRQSFLSVFSLAGGLQWSFESTATADPYFLHHDFAFEDSDSFLGLSGDSRDLARPLLSFLPLIRFLGTTLVRVWPASGKREVLWNYLYASDPRSEPDFLNDSYGTFPQPGRKFPASYDYVHGNSVQRLENGGVLVSSRNLQKVFRLAPGAKSIEWTVGPSTANDFVLDAPGAMWHRPHHATLLSDNRLLIFDNSQKSRVLLLDLDRASRKAKLVREFVPDPPAHSFVCGSAHLLQNGNINGFFPRSDQDIGTQTILVEFDAQTGKEVARGVLGSDTIRMRTRVEPLLSLDQEQWLTEKNLPTSSKAD